MKKTARVKRIGIALLICIGVVIGWYAQSRLLAPYRVIRIIETSATPAAATEVDATTLQLAIYNIAHGRGGQIDASNWTGNTKKQVEAHLSKIAQQVKDANVDILVLNEVDFQSTWSRHVDQAAYIAKLAGFGFCAQQRNMDVSYPFRRYRFGNAILSKYPIVGAKVVRFEPMSKKEFVFAGNHEGMLAQVRTPLGNLSVFAVHLEYRSEEVRVKSARIIKALAAKSTSPFVAMGDFNSAPSFAAGHRRSAAKENAIDLLLDSGLLSIGKPTTAWDEYLTFPSAHPDRAIDWIMCSAGLESGAVRVVQSGLSDHLMVTCRIGFKDARLP